MENGTFAECECSKLHEKFRVLYDKKAWKHTLTSRFMVCAASLTCPWSGAFWMPLKFVTLAPSLFADTKQLCVLKAAHFQYRTPAVLPFPLLVNKYPSIDRRGWPFWESSHCITVFGCIPPAMLTIYNRLQKNIFENRKLFLTKNVCDVNYSKAAKVWRHHINK